MNCGCKIYLFHVTVLFHINIVLKLSHYYLPTQFLTKWWCSPLPWLSVKDFVGCSLTMMLLAVMSLPDPADANTSQFYTSDWQIDVVIKCVLYSFPLTDCIYCKNFNIFYLRMDLIWIVVMCLFWLIQIAATSMSYRPWRQCSELFVLITWLFVCQLIVRLNRELQGFKKKKWYFILLYPQFLWGLWTNLWNLYFVLYYQIKQGWKKC